MDNPDNNQHFNVLISVGGGGLRISTLCTIEKMLDNCERSLKHYCCYHQVNGNNKKLVQNSMFNLFHEVKHTFLYRLHFLAVCLHFRLGQCRLHFQARLHFWV